jgi:uncharacterized protein YdaU (DUF1376 family)
MRIRVLSVMFLPLLLLVGVASPSSAWVRVGFRGPRVGVYLGPWPYWWGDYYDPYYDPYYPYYYRPYAYYDYAPYAVADPAPAAHNSHRDLRDIEKEIKRAREQVNFALDDGDITQARHDEEIGRLNQIEKEARSEADANAGHLTEDQSEALQAELRGETPRAPAARRSAQPSSETPRFSERRDPGTILTLVKDLQDMLDKKLSGTAITEAQHDNMSKRLDQIAKEAKSEASANGGYLTAEQENAHLLALDHAEEAIRNNFVLP